ncbi:MAG: hypothetical protein LAQ69_32455 [Acidobacteriia bacterium]|nr:hypothetical protein [Terriglobia bacterium]
MTVALALSLGSCRRGPPRAPSIGEAFVGPAVLNIRKDIPTESPTVATTKHGDRLEILQRRRRFLRVRTPTGAEGWTDERQLLAAEDMAYLRDLAKRAAHMPVQGQGTTYSEVNVHTQPSRSSPSFFQIKEKEKVDVLMHTVTPRADAPRKPLLPPPPKKLKSAPKKTAAKEPKYPPPPMPKPPGLPENWIELSKTARSDDEPPAEPEVDDKPILVDEWNLVRNHAGQTGWILTRRLIMAIPDEVAQYAEGRHIVSYFPLGQVQDDDQQKTIWLWTTIGKGTEPYDFDSFRVFIWSLRHHRYETAHIERNVRGYAPVLLKDVEFSASARSRSDVAAGKYTGFSICMENRDGQRVRREFVLLTNVVRYAGENPCEAPQPLDALRQPSVLETAPEPAPPPAATFSERFKKRLRGWFGR